MFLPWYIHLLNVGSPPEPAGKNRAPEDNGAWLGLSLGMTPSKNPAAAAATGKKRRGRGDGLDERCGFFITITHDGSMVLPYLVTWIPSIYPLNVSIYTSTMDPSWVIHHHSSFTGMPLKELKRMVNGDEEW